MRRLNRLLATLLVALLIPTTVLAGAVRLCLGHDGHAAMEFAHQPHDHGRVALDAPASSQTVHQAVVVDAADSCVDLALQATTSRAAIEANTLDRQTADIPVALIFPIDALGPFTRLACTKPQGIEQSVVAVSIHLAALRTVVLRI